MWDPPQPHETPSKLGLYLKEARLFLDGGAEQTIRVTSTFSLAFCVHAHREARINLSPHYLGTGGEVIFAAPSPQQKLRVGDNWFACKIQGNFLNDGVYSVRLMIVEDSTAIQVIDEALIFEVHDVVRDGAWHGKWPGVVRPALEWESCSPLPRLRPWITPLRDHEIDFSD